MFIDSGAGDVMCSLTVRLIGILQVYDGAAESIRNINPPELRCSVLLLLLLISSEDEGMRIRDESSLTRPSARRHPQTCRCNLAASRGVVSTEEPPQFFNSQKGILTLCVGVGGWGGTKRL